MNPYVSLLIMAAIALVVAIGGLVLSAIVSPNRRNRVMIDNPNKIFTRKPDEQLIDMGR